MTENAFFDELRKHLDENLPLVAWRKPEENIISAFLQQKNELFTTSDFTESGFVFAPFDSEKEAILIPEEGSEKLIFESPAETDLQEDTFQEENPYSPSAEEKQQHLELIKKALPKLKAGELNKVVLSRKEKISLEKTDPLKFFRRLLSHYPTAFVYLWFHPKVGCWLGATPETLLKTDGRRFRTIALAGTQKFGGTMGVEWSEKEKQEQQFVTDTILENLKSSGVENPEISAPYTARAGNLLHLRTDITGKIPNSKFQIPKGNSDTAAINRVSTATIISALHPTPAVGGLPKEKAKEFILSEEYYDREFYTGFLGKLNLQKNTQRSRTGRNVENLAYRAVKKETALFVNLRCMKVEDNAVSIFVGGGITKDSVAEDEWQETVNKAETMKKVLFE